MIDLALLREQQEYIVSRIKRKDPQFPIDDLVRLDNEVRVLRCSVEELRARKNELARDAQKGVTEDIRSQSREVSQKLKGQEETLAFIEKSFSDLYLRCPNIPLDEVPDGGKESNKVIKVVGEKPKFDFPVKNHAELGVANGWFDFEAAARMTASNFVLYRDKGVTLVYALALLMFEHNRRYGFTPILPPYLVNERSLEGAGNFPRFKDDAYTLERDSLYLIPTAEVSLANLYRDHIFNAGELPVCMTSWTSCFRREAGGYGATERGLIRIHQFEKVELFTVCKPEEAHNEHERMLACAEELLQMLGLSYRVVLLAAEDASFQSSKTYDIEVWMPGQGEYKEVSSISNCGDFQSRRCMIRYKDPEAKKNKLAYTLNGSSLALPRVMVALMETYQQADGSIKVPDILKSVTLTW